MVLAIFIQTYTVAPLRSILIRFVAYCTIYDSFCFKYSIHDGVVVHQIEHETAELTFTIHETSSHFDLIILFMPYLAFLYEIIHHGKLAKYFLADFSYVSFFHFYAPVLFFQFIF